MSPETPSDLHPSHLSDEWLEQQRERLEAMLEHMDLLLAQTLEDTQPVELGSSFGRLSRIDAIQMRGMAQMNRSQLEVRRQLVDLALRALDEGRYGRCRNCSGPITRQRLEALPETPFCIDCQESFERDPGR